MSDDDNELEAIWKKEHSLSEIIDRKNFKSYDELKKRLDEIMGFIDSAPTPKAKDLEVVEEPLDMEMNPSYKKSATMPPKYKPAPVVEDEEDDPDLAEFRKLIED